MERTTVVLITLVVYKIVLILIGVWANRRNQDKDDFFLGGRGVGAWVAALSASASSSSAWTLLGVSGAAYAWGLAAIWIFPGCVGGFLLNWYLLAPGLRRDSAERESLTVTEVIAGNQPHPWRTPVIYLASFIILFSFLFYVASQFQGSGKAFQGTFGMSPAISILLGSAIIIVYTMLGGFWAVSLTDSLQGLVMAACAILLPIGALVAVGGPAGMIEGMQAVEVVGYMGWMRDMPVVAGLGFIFGLMGISVGATGQPHVVNRFMSLKDEASVRRGRQIAIGWAVVVYTGMLVLGWCGRLLYGAMADSEIILVQVANDLFHPVIGGVIVAGVLSATMSTADSQLLVAASSVTHDLPIFHPRNALRHARAVVFLLSIGAVALALLGSDKIFNRVLFAWSAMGAAFGPLLLVTVLRRKVALTYSFFAMLAGFSLSVLAYTFPETKNTAYERILPYAVALVIAWLGSRGKDNSSAQTSPPTTETPGNGTG